MRRLVKSLRSLSLTERSAIISFVAGVILIALGIVRIVGSRYMDWHWILTDDPGVDAGAFYPAWNEVELATGIILALVGTVACTASLTYAILRKRKGV